MTAEEQALRERERCVTICRRRAELWRKTIASRSSIASAREEARARANEATYLADLLESGTDLSELNLTDGDDADA
jgi:hypothetical protein